MYEINLGKNYRHVYPKGLKAFYNVPTFLWTW